MADYQLTATDVVIRTEDMAYIPNDAANRDRIEYDEWLYAGGVPDPYVAPPPTPPALDANVRLDAGIAAALDVAVAVRDALQATPNNFTATNFAAAMIQLDALTQAFVAMLQAQAAPPP